MHETHHSSKHARSIPGLILELAMIVVGVFLGLMAEQWREGRHEQALAQASLESFRTEIKTNQVQVNGVRAYHSALAGNLNKFVNTGGPHGMQDMLKQTQFRGTEVVDFEHTAWDLALSTHSLSYLKPDMAYAISRLYTRQQSFQTLENSFMQSAFAPTTFADPNHASGLAISMMAYMGDVNIQEPTLLKMYAVVLPKIDSALGAVPSKAAR
ncbi:MAG TPA: hypothetical protein VIG47_17515 [Gemmatimonadaceae bacterium]